MRYRIAKYFGKLNGDTSSKMHVGIFTQLKSGWHFILFLEHGIYSLFVFNRDYFQKQSVRDFRDCDDYMVALNGSIDHAQACACDYALSKKEK